MFPNLVAQCLRDVIEQVERENAATPFASVTPASHVAEAVQVDVWQDRDLVRTWLQAGGDFTQDTFPVSLKSDKEVFLWIAEHNDYPRDAFEQHAAPELLANTDFMAKCIKFNRHLFRTAHASVKQDLGIILLTFGADDDYCPERHHFDSGNIDYQQFYDKGLAKINDELERNQAYFSTVLGKFVQQSTLPLALLHQDSIPMIASFAAPSEARLLLLHNAQRKFELCFQYERERRERRGLGESDTDDGESVTD